MARARSAVNSANKITILALVLLALLSPIVQSRADETKECKIKGNVNTRGERIYHLPGQKYYDKTVISSTHGERWFCSEKEARAAGWRRSKV